MNFFPSKNDTPAFLDPSNILLLSFLYAFLHLYLRMRTQAEKFILLSSLVFFILVFISGAGIIGNSNMLIFCLIISAISSPIGQRM